MATRLRNPLRREIAIGGKPYMLTITTDGFKLVPKGKRKGRHLAWRDLVSGEAALAVALNASLEGSRSARRSARRPETEAETDHPTAHGGSGTRSRTYAAEARSPRRTRRKASSRSRLRPNPPAT